MSLRASYTALAPIYDVTIRALTRSARARSCAWLAPKAPMRVLVTGVGTGLDLPHLPPHHEYTGLDLTWAMLARSRPRAASRNYHAVQGDAMALPFAPHSFDAAVLHLILAVVPDPARCLAECLRVLRPGGTLLIFDKFLRPGERARLRRLVNPLSRRLATRLDVVFEEVVAGVADAEVEHDQPALAGGWFRLIRIRRTG
jgi:ubiquinone/menaquinone biosynthesis C-methylase UbiE